LQLAKRYLDEWKRAVDFAGAVKNNLGLNDLKTAANREYFAVEQAEIAQKRIA